MPERSEGIARQGHYSQVMTEENSYYMDYYLVITWLLPGYYLVSTRYSYISILTKSVFTPSFGIYGIF